jgi:phospholipase/lecithinase/hemolysin
MRSRLLAGLVGSLLLSLGGSSTASAYSSVYVFGDSLSDSGAFGHLLGGAFCPAPPYAGCRFSNGPTWAENLAAGLGAAANTAYAPGGGTNYAIGGERSDELLASGTAINGGQIPDFSGDVGGVADPNALYIVWAGGNNFLQNSPPGTFLPADAAQDIVDSVLALSALGATDFLVANLPIADPWAFTFNAALSAGLATLTGLNIVEFDVLSFFIGVVSNPAAYGLTNVSTPCFDGVTACANPGQYLLWDTVHPTAAAHELLAEAAFHLVPEPGTGLLVIAGLLGIAGWRRAHA